MLCGRNSTHFCFFRDSLTSFRSLAQIAPSPLSHSAHELNSLAGGHWQEILAKSWEADSGSLADLEPECALLSWIFLQPYAEYLADHTEWAAPSGTPSVWARSAAASLRWARCGRKATAGNDRSSARCAGRSGPIGGQCAPRARGRRRAQARRLYRERVQPCARRSVRETCHSYIKTVDLTQGWPRRACGGRTGNDPLNLWATEHGYLKLQSNFLGI